MKTGMIVVLATLVAILSPDARGGNTEFIVVASPQVLASERRALLEFYGELSHRDGLALYLLDGRSVFQRMGLQKTAKGTIAGKDTAVIRALNMAMEQAGKAEMDDLSSSPTVVFSHVATATMASAAVDRRVVVILGVTPLASFAGADRAYSFDAKTLTLPSDGLLHDPGPYRVKKGALAKLEIYWQLPKQPETGQVYDDATARFWQLYLREAGAAAMLRETTTVQLLRVARLSPEPPPLIADDLRRDQTGMISLAEAAPKVAKPVAPAPPPPATPNVVIVVRDFAAADGDQISIKINDRVICQNLSIQRTPVSIPVHLPPGKHTLTITAANDGDSGPTTVGLRIKDLEEVDVVSEQVLGIQAGETASMIITMEAAN